MAGIHGACARELSGDLGDRGDGHGLVVQLAHAGRKAALAQMVRQAVGSDRALNAA